MKKLICFLLSALCTLLYAHAENKITINTSSGHSGDEVDVVVSLTNSDPVVGAQVTIPLNDNLKYVDKSAVLNADRANGHNLSAALIDNELRVFIYTTGLNSLNGNEGELFSFKLRLGKVPAAYALTPKVVLSSASGTSVSSTASAGAVTLLAPQLEVTSTTINYGHVPIRGTYTASLMMKNTGNVTANVSDLLFNATEFTPSTTTFTVAPGATKGITITYKPTVRGAISKTVTIISDAANGQQKASLVADPYSVNELHVGSASGNSDTEQEIALTMNNMEPIVGMQCAFVLPSGIDYVENSFVTAERTSGLTASSFYTDSNRKLMLFLYSEGNATCAGNDGVIGTFKVRLNGKSGTYTLTPTEVVLSNATIENMVSASTAGRVTVTSPTISANASIAYGDKPMDKTIKATYAIKNTGGAPLIINNVTFLKEGFSIEEELPITIEYNQTKNITVCYDAVQAGDFSTIMNVYSNDPAQRLKNVEITGSAYAVNNIKVDGLLSYDRKTFTASVSMDNASEIVAVQMDIHWPEGMPTNNIQLELADRCAGMTSSVSKPDDNTLRVILYSLSNVVITGTEGELFKLTYTNDDDELDVVGTQIYVDKLVLSTVSGDNAHYARTDYTGWIKNVSNSYSNTTFDNYQTIKGLPAGKYRLGVQAFYRAGTASADYTNYISATPVNYAYIYANGTLANIALASSEASRVNLGGSETALTNGKYIPNDMQAACLYFEAGKYQNYLDFELKEGESLKIGIKKSSYLSSDWVVCDNWTLTYNSYEASTVSATYTVEANGVLMGDVNGDGKVNVIDLTNLLNYIVNGTADVFIEAAADMNEDSRINVIDMTNLIEVILNSK